MTRYTIDGEPLPQWETELLDAIDIERLEGERDRARETAVRLEQELAALSTWAILLTRDLERMHSEGAIDLGQWPAAKALVENVNGRDPLSCP